jgi:hypothetical protein
MFTFLLSLISTPAFAGGGVYMSLEKVTTLVRCNNGQVKFQEELWDYGSEGSDNQWALVVNHKGKKEVFRVHEKKDLLSEQGSKVNLVANYERENDDGTVTDVGAYLETSLKFDGSAGSIRAWEYESGGKGAAIIDSLKVKDCYLE